MHLSIYSAVVTFYSHPHDGTHITTGDGNLRVFVMGKSGTGKSTLIYGLLGLDVENLIGELISTKGISVEQIDNRGTPVTLLKWESPNLKQPKLEDSIIAQIHDVDLALLTVRMDDTRLRPGDKTILRKLGKIFGTRIWHKTVIALTYANRVDFIDEDNILKQTKQNLEAKKKEWIDGIHEVLKDENIPWNIICSIPILPAGYYTKPELYNEPWKDIMTNNMLSRVADKMQPAAKKALKVDNELKTFKNYCTGENEI